MTTTGGSFTLRRTASAICTRQGSARTSPRVGIVVFSLHAAYLTPSTVPRGNLPEHVMSSTQLEPSWKALGMTARTYSWGKSVPRQLAYPPHTGSDRAPRVRVSRTMQVRSREHDGVLHPPGHDRGRAGEHARERAGPAAVVNRAGDGTVSIHGTGTA